MEAAELEIRVLEIVQAIRQGLTVEDDLVEIKGSLIDARPAARRIAGHANRANGDPILWIVGVDERTGAVRPLDVDFDGWWRQVAAEFDEAVYPELIAQVRVATGDGEGVFALLFSTLNAPYVVKTHQGGLDREVPLRVATGVRSARRHELLELVGPALRMPAVDVLWSEADLWTTGEIPDHRILRIETRLLIRPRRFAEDPIFLPSDGMRVSAAALTDEDDVIWQGETDRPNMANPYAPGTAEADANRMERLDVGVYVTGPCAADMEAGFHVPVSTVMQIASRIAVTLTIPVLGGRSVVIKAVLRGPERGVGPKVEWHWGYPGTAFD